MKTKKRPTMQQIADACGCHIDTIFRIKGGRNKPSPELAEKLEEFLGIDRRRFIWPHKFGDPWEVFEEKFSKDGPGITTA